MVKKGLCIGVAYTRPSDPDDFRLDGTHDDALRVAAMLEARGYSVEVLLDKEPYIDPMKENIKAAISRLVANAEAEDCLFFHFSGHGDQVPCLTGNEYDGKDEVILPSDWEIDLDHLDPDDPMRYPVHGRILDDELHDWLVDTIPEGCYLNALFDNCHSGTALDLDHRRYCGSPEPYNVGSPITTNICEEPDSLGSPTERQIPPIPTSRVGSGKSSRKNSLGIEGAMGFHYSMVPGPAVPRNSKRTLSMPRGRLIVRGESKDGNPVCLKVHAGNVFSWCACSDAQVAGETRVTASGKPSGYMVDAFLKCLEENSAPTYEQLLLELNRHLRRSCHEVNSQDGHDPTDFVRQDPEFGSSLLPDMKAKIVI